MSFWENFDYGTPDDHLKAATDKIAELERQIEEMHETQAARTCAVCKHWEADLKFDKRGYCAMADDPPPHKSLAVAEDREAVFSGRLNTHADFSCNQWESKE